MIAERTIQYGSLWPLGHFGRTVAEQFAKAIAQRTCGRIQVQITPPSPDEELTQKVINGTIAMTSGHAIQDYVPELGLGYLPYLYRTFDEYTSIWTLGGPISDSIMTKFKDRNIPVLVLGYSVIGFRDMILRDSRIKLASDFKGLRVRFDGSTTSRDTFLAFGAQPQGIEYHLVKDAFKKGKIDAAANTSFNLIYMEWYEVTKNVSLTSHQILTNLEIVNIDFWNNLPPDEQDIFRKAMREACANFTATAKHKRDEAIEQLSRQYGLEVNEVPDSTKADLGRAVEPMKLAFVKKYGLEKEYQEVLSSLSKLRLPR